MHALFIIISLYCIYFCHFPYIDGIHIAKMILGAKSVAACVKTFESPCILHSSISDPAQRNAHCN